MGKIKNALSIDTEDWYQGMLEISHNDWPNYEDRINHGLDKILSILNGNNIKATFFILGYIAERRPDIVRNIAEFGHEIASHGYSHRLIYQQTRQEFKDDVVRSKRIIESITKVKVRGYRAPFFSVTKACLWALDILQDLGFEYDSSVFPTKNFLYGMPDAPHSVYRINNTGIMEFPLSVLKVMGFNFPICGGFYLRSLPYGITKYGIRRFNNKGWPVVLYMHPWEMDAWKPSIPMKLKWKIIHEYNIGRMEDKFKRLINDFSFTTISEVLFGNQG